MTENIYLKSNIFNDFKRTWNEKYLIVLDVDNLTNAVRMRVHAVAISVLAIAIFRESKGDKTAGNSQITLFNLIFSYISHNFWITIS